MGFQIWFLTVVVVAGFCLIAIELDGIREALEKKNQEK
jgi:hypothetical protein